MKASTFTLFATIAARTAAFTPSAHSGSAFSRNMSANSVPLANGAMSFDRVCREWRCKYTGDKATSESLEAISKLVDEYLPKIKAVSSGVTVNRLVCGACLDFKLMTTVSTINATKLWLSESRSICLFLTIEAHKPVDIPSRCLYYLFNIQVPLEDFGPWEKSGYAPEEEFLEKLRAIEGVSQVETQTITNMVI